ncbi:MULTISPECIES: hypothetical protein [unclassified Knoellia]|uniref:hypothetical protein n=1 Tax=Knoellia altitudinis TaxID=3404795 RepID=UPI0036244B62
MTSHAARVFAEEAASHDLPMPAWAFAVVALGVFALLLSLTWAFRGNAKKHAAQDEHNDHSTPRVQAHAHGGTMHDQSEH